jgi:hypothetical protein
MYNREHTNLSSATAVSFNAEANLVNATDQDCRKMAVEKLDGALGALLAPSG